MRSKIGNRILDIVNNIPSSILEKSVSVSFRMVVSQKILDYESTISKAKNISEREKEEKELLASCLQILRKFITTDLVSSYVQEDSVEVKKIQGQLKKYFAEEFKKNFSAWLS